MTSIQNEYQKNQEAARHNRAAEDQAKNELDRAKARDKQDKKTADKDRIHKYVDTGVKHLGNVMGSGTKLAATLMPLALGNHGSFYDMDPGLVKDTANISFQTPVGYAKIKTDVNQIDAAGIAIINWVPALGDTVSAETSAINVAAKQMYAWIRSANSGARNYESSDLVMYLLAFRSPFVLINEIKRILGAVGQYSAANRFVGAYVVEALGINVEDAQLNAPIYRARLNTIISKINAFYIPKTLPLYNRSEWLSSVFLLDRQSPKAQVYAYKCAVYQMWNSYAETGTELTAFEIQPEQASTVGGLLDVLDNMVNKYMSIEDIAIIGGDILKAYGEGNMLQIPKIEENHQTGYVVDEWSLLQLEHTTLVGDVVTKSCGLYQKNNLIRQGSISDTNAWYNGAIWAKSHEIPDKFGPEIKGALLNVYDLKDVQPIDVMRITRNIANRGLAQKIGPNEAWHAKITNYGSEVFTVMTVHFRNEGNGQMVSVVAKMGGDVVGSTSRFLNTITLLMQFRYLPHLWYYDNSSGYNPSGQTEIVGPLIEADNYAYIAPENLSNMHYVAINSEMAIPSIKGNSSKDAFGSK